MKNKRKKKKGKKVYFLVFIIFILFIGLLFYFVNDNRYNNFFLNSLKDLSASVYRLADIPVNKKNPDVTNEINKDLEKEIEDLKKTLNLNKTMSDKKLINASIIKRSTAFWYNTITIDKGSKNGIKKGNAVINDMGLIGKIINVNNYTSDVKLLTSKNDNNSISAMFYVDNNPYYGLISEYNIEKNELYLKNVIGDFDINKIKNTNVVTSGLSDSFSSGLLIGKIKEIKKDSYGISNNIKITPAANFNNIKIVSVVGDTK